MEINRGARMETNSQKETETNVFRTLELMKKLKGIQDPKLKKEFMKSVKEYHNETLNSFDNEVLEAITGKEITTEEARKWFEDRKSK